MGLLEGHVRHESCPEAGSWKSSNRFSISYTRDRTSQNPYCIHMLLPQVFILLVADNLDLKDYGAYWPDETEITNKVTTIT